MPRATTRRKRVTTKGTKSAPTLNPPIYIWAMRSSKPRAGGAFIIYEVRLNDDGGTSCNCPGWQFKKKDQPRGCKHTRHVAVEAADFYKRFKRGEELPTVVPDAEMVQVIKNLGGELPKKKAETAAEKEADGFAGRIVEFD